MPTFRCPHCGRRFSMVEVSGPSVPCPGCGESVSAGPQAGAPIKRAEPKPTAPTGQPAAAAPGAAPARKTISLKKTCPACGTQFPGDDSKCPQCGASYKAAKIQRDDPDADGGAFAPEKKGIQSGVIGGIAMIAIAAIWFFGGLAAGYIFYYPPILALIGIYAVIKGLATGNLSGGKRQPRR